MNEPVLKRYRIPSIDLLRGIIMVIMALDHVRDFFHADAMNHDPVDLSTTTPALFFTRIITHFCAPVFLFLAGISAYLNGLNRTKAGLRGFLIKRGLWLIGMELLVVTLALTFNPFYNLFILQVIWATAISMIILGLLTYLPYPAILCIGLFIFFGHNLLDIPEARLQGNIPLWWTFLHGRNGMITLNATHTVFVLYSFLPWTGIMIVGYCCGRLFGPAVLPARRVSALLLIGVSAILLFIIGRWINQYGNPTPWQIQKNGLFSFLSFINTNKYPPSLFYSCMTLGPALLLLAIFEKAKGSISRFFTVFGQVPLFYYVIHFYVIHLTETICFFASGHGMKEMATVPFAFRPKDFGYSLPVVYLIWMGLIALMYPLCKWYANYKKTHTQWWLSYM